jgi:ParB-like chromosome segregation protein Spo0J
MNKPEIYCAYDALVPVGDMKPNPRNPNKHPDSQIALLAKIISAQGWRAPITVSNRSGLIVRGHGRLDAALELGLEQCPVDYQDYADEASEWADMLADNKLAELAETDGVKLRDLLEELDTGALDIELTGFTEEGILELSEMDALWAEQSGASNSAQRKLGNKKSVVKAVIYLDELAIFEEAISATGLQNRGEAVVSIARAYLDAQR